VCQSAEAYQEHADDDGERSAGLDALPGLFPRLLIWSR
jgi:hypothetical protein